MSTYFRKVWVRVSVENRTIAEFRSNKVPIYIRDILLCQVKNSNNLIASFKIYLWFDLSTKGHCILHFFKLIFIFGNLNLAQGYYCLNKTVNQLTELFHLVQYGLYYIF